MKDEFRSPPVVDEAIRQIDEEVPAPSDSEITASWMTLARRLEFGGHAPQWSKAQAPGAGSQRRTAAFAGTGRRFEPGIRWGWATVLSLVVVALGIMTWRHTKTGVSRSASNHTYATTATQQANVTLDDGTRVTLAPNSRLRVLEFGAQSRTVDVDGEAYFNVAPSNTAPFVVQGGKVVVRVLGTAFLVRHDAGTQRARISVADGKVHAASLDYPERGVTLSAGQIGEITDSTTNVSTMNDVAPGTEWFHGQLVFRDMPLSTVLETLSRWYGYQFHCADSALPRRVVTIGINMQSSTDALAALEQILLVNFAVVGDTITLTPQSGKPAKGTPRIRTYDSWTPTREVGR